MFVYPRIPRMVGSIGLHWPLTDLTLKKYTHTPQKYRALRGDWNGTIMEMKIIIETFPIYNYRISFESQQPSDRLIYSSQPMNLFALHLSVCSLLYLGTYMSDLLQILTKCALHIHKQISQSELGSIFYDVISGLIFFCYGGKLLIEKILAFVILFLVTGAKVCNFGLSCW